MTLSVFDLVKKADTSERAPRGDESSHCYVRFSVYAFAFCRFVRACTKILADNDLVELAHLESAKYEDIKFSNTDSAGICKCVALLVFPVRLRQVSGP